MKLHVANLLIVFLVLSSCLLQLTMAIAPTAAPTICGKKCGVRCSRSGWKKQCLRLCNICCQKCNYCVPSGPRADKAECPCYRDMKNQKGKPKCP